MKRRPEQDRILSQQKITNPNEHHDSDEILQELCNPHSLKIKEVKESLRDFCDSLTLKQIITAQRNEQLKTITDRPKRFFESLTEEQIINLVKWEVIVDFFINYTNFLSNLPQNGSKKWSQAKKLPYFSQVYKISLRKLFTATTEFDSKKGFNSWQIPQDNNNELNLKNKFKYACFEVLACILDLNLIMKFKSCEDANMIEKRNVIQNDAKIFYFVDVGEVLEKGNLWLRLQKFFMGQDQEKQGQENERIRSNREILKLFYLGLTIESLQFESVSSSLRFTSQLLRFIINQNYSSSSSSKQQYASAKTQQKQVFTMTVHLNKLIYFLRILKKNNYNIANLNGSQDTQSADVTPVQSSDAISRRSILSRQTMELSKPVAVQTNDIKIQSTNKYGTENESNFLNELEYKAQKLIQKISSKYKDLATELQYINDAYEPLSQILALKNSAAGTQLASNYTTKRNKQVKFIDQEKKIFFVFMAKQLKKIYNSFDLDWNLLYNNCKQTFLNFQHQKKLENELKHQENKKIKKQLIEEFKSNLQRGYGIIAKTSKTIKMQTNTFLDMVRPKPQHQHPNSKPLMAHPKSKSKSSHGKSSNNQVYFPTLKPKLNIQVQNRLKLKQIKEQKKNDKTFFLSQQKLTFQIIQTHAPKNPKVQPASAVISSKKIEQSYKSQLITRPKQKSTSLPSKIKVNTNYDIKTRFDSIKDYEKTRKTVLERKFSYEMILCKRQNGDSLQKQVFKNPKRDNPNESQLYEKIEIQRKQRSERSRLRLGTKIYNQQRSDIKFNQSYESKKSQKRNRTEESQQRNNNPGQIPSKVFDSLIKATKKRNNQRRDSLLLRSSVDKVKKASKFTEQNEQPPQKSEIPLSFLNTRKSEDIGTLLQQSISVIIENCKKVTKNGAQKTRLKLDSRVGLLGKKKDSGEFTFPKIIEQESKLENLKFEDASEILTSMEHYYRTFLQIQLYNELLRQKYQVYLQLNNLTKMMHEKQTFLFKNIQLTVLRKEILTKKQKQRYWSTFRIFFQHDQKVLVVEIDERSIIQNPETSFSAYLAQKLDSMLCPKKYSLTNEKNNKPEKDSFICVGNLGGNLDLYYIKLISLYEKGGNGNELIEQTIKSKKTQKDQTFRFLQTYFQSKDSYQILGLDKKKNTIDCIELYITRAAHHTGQHRKIEQFVSQLFFAPLNQYILDWGSNSLAISPTFQAVGQEQARTAFSRQQNKLYHIYFLNRSYEMRSRFKTQIKKMDQRYPSFSYQQFLEGAYCLSNEQRQFCENVQMIEYGCKNLIFNKKYILFNLKIIKAVQKQAKKVFIMIEQKNLSQSNHKVLFFVFPLRPKLKAIHQTDDCQAQLQIINDRPTTIRTSSTLKESQKLELIRNYYTSLMLNIQKYHSLNHICDFLVANDTIQIQSWPDTVFNKLLLAHPHITVIKKVNMEDELPTHNYLATAKNTFQILKKKSTNLQEDLPHQPNLNKKLHVFATLKVFILNSHNLVVGVIQISGQSFLFISLFDQLISKVPRFKCRALSRYYIDKNKNGPASTGKQFRNSPKDSRRDADLNSRKPTPSNSRITGSNDSFLPSAQKVTKKTITTNKALKTQKIFMTEEQEMSNIKQRLMGLFKFETELSIELNLDPSSRRSFTADNHTSKYRMNMKIDGEPIKLMDLKYYWSDLTPKSRKKSLNFRMRDDSLLLIKLTKKGYNLLKLSKVRERYLETYMKKMADNKMKFKGNAMNDQLRRQDKAMYYESYKETIEEIENYFYAYNLDHDLLVKIKLGISQKGTYHIGLVDFDIDATIESAETSSEDKEKLMKVVKFQVKAENLSMFKIGSLGLSQKMLNKKRFRKRINHIIKDELDSIFRTI